MDMLQPARRLGFSGRCLSVGKIRQQIAVGRHYYRPRVIYPSEIYRRDGLRRHSGIIRPRLQDTGKDFTLVQPLRPFPAGRGLKCKDHA